MLASGYWLDMTTPQEPAPDTETDVTPGDVTENPTKPQEDGSNPHTDEDDDATLDPGHVPAGPQETNPAADDS